MQVQMVCKVFIALWLINMQELLICYFIYGIVIKFRGFIRKFPVTEHRVKSSFKVGLKGGMTHTKPHVKAGFNSRTGSMNSATGQNCTLLTEILKSLYVQVNLF
jgi:hypothetical protein